VTAMTDMKRGVWGLMGVSRGDLAACFLFSALLGVWLVGGHDWPMYSVERAHSVVYLVYHGDGVWWYSASAWWRRWIRL
jgi:hypothetical protein